MSSERNHSEADLQRIFDRTAVEPDALALQRMEARAAEIPAQRGRVLGRSWRWVMKRRWVPVTVAVSIVAVLALSMWLEETISGPETMTGIQDGIITATQAVEGATPLAMVFTGGRDTDAVYVADPFAGLDEDWDADDDSLALLDPPHMVFANVDAGTWVSVYSAILEE